LLGVPFNLGAAYTGTEYAVEYLLGEYPELKNMMEIIASVHEEEDLFDTGKKFINSVAATSKLVAERVREVAEDGYRPVVIGGDHSVSLGSVSGILSSKKAGVIWIDAHGDMNTPETSPSGNIHGMVLSALMGYGDPKLTRLNNGQFLDPKDVLIFGVRDLDPGELKFIAEKGINVITYDEISNLGLEASLKRARSLLKVDNLHISFDLDSIDPEEAPGVSVPVERGLKREEVLEIFSSLDNNYEITSVDIV